jgi:hypothetical protein
MRSRSAFRSLTVLKKSRKLLTNGIIESHLEKTSISAVSLIG